MHSATETLKDFCRRRFRLGSLTVLYRKPT
nr:MAG TPA: hypothetical protein [Caudoviricetes sp.]